MKTKTLKDFKKEIKNLGYRTKTYIYNTSNLRFLEVLDNEKNFICGSGANCYDKKTIEEHKKVFDLLNKNKNMVFDKDERKVSF